MVHVEAGVISAGKRSALAQELAKKVRAVSEVEAASTVGAFVGFDGFVDTICRVVERRRAPGSEGAEPMRSMRQFAQRVAEAAGESANIELLVERVKLGGNGPILALALATLGGRVRCAGAVESPVERGEVDPVFDELQQRCFHVLPLCPPGRTEALEFRDGKVMLGKLETLDAVTWARVVEAAGGLAQLRTMLQSSDVVAMGNWTMLFGMKDIWEGLAREGLPGLEGRRWLFVDLADPAKRSDEDVLEAMEQLRRLDALSPVALGVNAAEAHRLCALAGSPLPRLDTQAGAEEHAAHALLAAKTLREAVGLTLLLAHTRKAAAAADETGAWALASTYTRTPVLSTGAGDHFNAGCCFALALGWSVVETLTAGVGVSGVYVRRGRSPDRGGLAAFLEQLPPPEEEASA